MAKQWLAGLKGSAWSGKGELWLDAEGNNADLCDCEMKFDEKSLHYFWSYQGEPQNGCYTFDDRGVIWVDSWHQPESVLCTDAPDAWGIFTIECTYTVPSNPDWGWRSKLSERPDGKLVLQMTNVTPWGEEGRAVRMVFSKAHT